MTSNSQKLRKIFWITFAVFWGLSLLWLILGLSGAPSTATRLVWGIEGLVLGVGLGIKIAETVIAQQEEK